MSLGFFSNLCFSGKMHTKRRLEKPTSCTGGQSQRMDPRGIASQYMGIRIFALFLTVHDMQIWLVKWPLFKLKIWKTLGKPCPFINYCQIINSTWTVENKSQIIRLLHKLILNTRFTESVNLTGSRFYA